MTEEKLEKEAIKASDKKCVKGCSKYYRYGFQDGYITGAEPREKQIAELKEQLERAERARDYWKDSSFDWRHKCTSRRPFKVAVKAQKQLTKAKGIINELLNSCFGYNSKTVNYEVKAKAEQFLKEVEE